MSSTLHLEEVMEHVLGGVERLVSNDLTAIILIDQDGTPFVARQRVGFGYGMAIESLKSESLSSLDVIGRLHGATGAVVIDGPLNALGPAKCVVGAPMRIGDQQIGFLVAESAMKGSSRKTMVTSAGDRRSGSRGDLQRSIGRPGLRAGRCGRAAASRTRVARCCESDIVDRGVDRRQSAPRGRRGFVAASTARATAPVDTGSAGRDEDVGARTPADRVVGGSASRVDRGTGDGPREPQVPAGDGRARSRRVRLGTRLAFYRVAQEALGNIAKHTQATAVEITLSSGESIELRIQDNGGGFDITAVPAGHLGLIIMRERAEAVGAKLEIDALPGRGTDIRLSVAGV